MHENMAVIAERKLMILSEILYKRYLRPKQHFSRKGEEHYMDAKIIVTSPHAQFTELALESSQESGIKIRVVEAILEDAVEQAAEICGKEDIAVIVSRGGTALAISKAVNVPIVAVETNDFDILIALWEARKYSERIAYLSYDYQIVPFDFESLIDILGVSVKQFFFSKYEEMSRQISQAKKQGIEVIVSGSSGAMNLAEKAGLRGILVPSGKRTMLSALQRAKWIEELRTNDRKNSMQLETIINLSSSGIIAMDKNGVINVMNRMAEKMIGLKRELLIGKKLSGYLMDPVFYRIIENSVETTEKVIKINENDIIVNSVAITAKDEDYGKVITLQEVAKLEQLEQSVRRQMHTRGLKANIFFEDIVADSDIMKTCIDRAKRFAATDGTVLIYGESGTGKEMFAQSIHNFSERRVNPFVAVNCAALPETLLESELFGYEEGAFTGARKGGKAGLFELAHKGTLFLDELTSVPHKVQAQLLRVLQEKQVLRIGGDKLIPVDVRIIAATNERLRDAVAQGNFREDLYYRLNVLNLEIPPLRERAGDIPGLVKHFIDRLNFRLKKEIKGVSPELMKFFLSCVWPGNVRELMNCLERLAIMSEDKIIGIDQLNRDEYSTGIKAAAAEDVFSSEGQGRLDDNVLQINAGSLEDMEKQIFKWFARKYDNNQTRIAKELGICRTTYWKKIKQISEEGKQS